MINAEREVPAYSGFDEKSRIWNQATPNRYSSEVNSLTNKTQAVRELVADGGIEFFFDLRSARMDMQKGFSEWQALMHDPIYRGEGYPHGGHKKVLGMGGMGSINALHYWDLTKTLRSLNYDAKMFAWPVNLDAPRKMGRRLLNYARDEVHGTGHKAAIFGHSLGSFQWMAAFAENPEEFIEYIDEAYLDESPIPGKLNRVLKVGSLFIPFDKEDISMGKSLPLFHQLEASGDIKVTAIESSNDPMLRGRTMAGSESDHYIMDGSSHVGGGVNPDFVKVLAYKLVGEEVDFRRVPRVHHAPVVPMAA